MGDPPKKIGLASLGKPLWSVFGRPNTATNNVPSDSEPTLRAKKPRKSQPDTVELPSQ